MRVLIVKTSSLGDVIHTLPALTDAANALPAVKFDWAIEEAFAEIPSWHPAVDRVIPVALRRWRRSPLQSFGSPEWKRCKQALRKYHYDAVIDAQGLLKSAWLSRFVKAPRYGMDRESAREGLASLFYHHKLSVPRDMHAVERTRLLFSLALKYPLPESRGDYGVRANLCRPADELPPGLLFFHGTARAEKLWPEDYWVTLGEHAAGAGLRVWLPWGDEVEQARAERIAAQLDNAQVLPRLDLRGLASMLLQVRTAVAVDTGLGHLSAALDVPTVSLYGPTKASLVGAYGDNQVHLSSPASSSASAEEAMRAITPDHCWRAVSSLLPAASDTAQTSP